MSLRALAQGLRMFAPTGFQAYMRGGFLSPTLATEGKPQALLPSDVLPFPHCTSKERRLDLRLGSSAAAESGSS